MQLHTSKHVLYALYCAQYKIHQWDLNISTTYNNKVNLRYELYRIIRRNQLMGVDFGKS